MSATLLESMPVLLDVRDIGRWLKSNWRGRMITADDLLSLSARVGRNRTPDLLVELILRKLLDDDALPAAVCKGAGGPPEADGVLRRPDLVATAMEEGGLR
jgi:hypothetical protein